MVGRLEEKRVSDTAPSLHAEGCGQTGRIIAILGFRCEWRGGFPDRIDTLGSADSARICRNFVRGAPETPYRYQSPLLAGSRNVTIGVPAGPQFPEVVMSQFELVTRFKPAGDQPEAIRQMIEGIEAGLSHQTLLGVTGSGKTFSIANV